MNTRPLGVSILAVLHFCGGVFLAGSQLWFLSNTEKLQGPLAEVGATPAQLIATMVFLAALNIAAGVGMWRGAAWGWWCGALYYVDSIIRNAAATAMVYSIADQIEPNAARGPGFYAFKYGARVVVHFLILLYFFKENVLEYFDLAPMNKWGAIGKLLGVAIAFTLVGAAISFLQSD